MKKLLHFLLIVTFVFINNYSLAQCNISDFKVKVINFNSSTCEVTFDLSWTQDINSGNKFAYIHIWAQQDYQTPVANWINMYHNSSHYPKAADLVNTLSTIVIDDNHADNPFVGTIYHPDPTYVLPQPNGLSIVKVHLNNTLIERVTVQNIKLTLPSCTGIQTIKFDVWASQAANGKIVSCVTEGTSLVLNQIKLFGSIFCTSPTQFQVIIQNAGPALDKVTYKVYLDYAPEGILNSTDTLVFASDSINVSANMNYYSAITGYLPYSGIYPTSIRPLIAVMTIPGWEVDMVATIQNGCAVLPVKFTSFSAVQLIDKVVLNWQIASEQNNKGFEVQRKLASGIFESIAFVPSNTFGGNSNLLMKYTYHDIGNLKGAGQVFYRIKQLDLDDKYNYSDIKVIKNNAKKIDLLIYPNPAKDILYLSMPEALGLIEVVLRNIEGKEIRRWSGLKMNRLELIDVYPGIYILNIFVKETGDVLQKKIIVQ